MKKLKKHERCTNCGQCCGITPISKKEEDRIRNFLDRSDKTLIERLKNQKRDILTCQFRDTEKKQCAIYPVRPLICKMFGVVQGLTCINGNTANADGTKIITGESRKIMPKFY